MNIQWEVQLVDKSTGTERVQSLAHTPGITIDLFATHLALNTQPEPTRSTLKLFLADGVNLVMREGHSLLWVGLMDLDTGAWVEAFYGGRIQKITGGTEGSEHAITLDLEDWSYLFQETNLAAWPTPLTENPPLAGFPPGHDVADWLITGATLTSGRVVLGLVAQELVDVDWGGIANPWGVRIPESSLPGTHAPIIGPDDHLGAQWKPGLLRQLLEDMVAVTRHVDDGKHPVFFMRPVISTVDPTRLRPQFCWIDEQATTGAPVAAFSDAPGPGEYLIGQPAIHTRDAGPQRTRLPVEGVGVDPATGVLIYTEGTDAAHVAAYPQYHKANNTRDAATTQEPSLHTLAGVADYAARLEAVLGVPRGQIEFRTDQRVQVGEWITYTDAKETLDHVRYPVNAVEIDLTGWGVPVYTVHVGHRHYEPKDILLRGTPQAPLPPSAGNGGQSGVNGVPVGLGSQAQGVPRTGAIVREPTNADWATIDPTHDATPGLDIRQSRFAAPLETVGDAATRPAPSDIFRVRRWVAALVDHVKALWVDKYGTPHAQAYFIPFTTDRTYYWAQHQRLTIRAARMPDDPACHGVTYTIRVNRAGIVTLAATVTWSSGTVLSAPVELFEGDMPSVAAVGVSSPSPLTLISGDPLT